MHITLTDFARVRLFPKEPRPNTIRDITAEAFERYLNEHPPLQDLPGYASFCRLHVYRNWTSTRCLTVPITPARYRQPNRLARGIPRLFRVTGAVASCRIIVYPNRWCVRVNGST